MTATTAIPYQTSPQNLGRAALAAVAAGAAILVLFVLPAEYGIDPTGIGRAIGLTELSAKAEEADGADIAPPAAGPARPIAVPEQTRDTILRTTPYRSDERTLTLAPHSGAEIKARMQAGDQFIFSWRASGPVKMDMHGERSLTAQEATTYWKQKGLSAAQGSLMAPFAGIHGWYWRNQGETPVTLTIRTAGFYAGLIQPNVG